jgi:MATE family multidrug resistance protein
MKWSYRLKRWVAPGLRVLAGWRRLRPDTGKRLQGQRPSPSVTPEPMTPMRELVNLAWPIAAGMLGETALGLVDTKLVGGLGPAALGGVGMATVLLYLGYSMVFGLMRGVKVRAANAVGAGRGGDAIRYAHAGIVFGVAAGVVLFFAAHDLTAVLRWLQVDPAMIPYARDYLEARSTGAVGTCTVAALIQYRQGMGDARTPMVVGLVGNLVNAGLAYSLIYGRFGLPALGARGAGYGTAMTEMLELAVLLALVVREGRSQPKPSITLRQAIREVAGLGVPTGLHFGLEVAAFTTFTAILGSFGAIEMAAHQITMNTLRASFLPGVAVAEAASVLVARSLGRRRLDEAERTTRAALALGVGFMTACGVVFGVFGATIAGSFSDDAAVIAIARRLFLVAAVFQTLDAINMILRGALRGAKDVRWVAVVGTLIVWCAIPGTAFVLGRMLGWGAFGGWIGFVIETALGAVVMGYRWSRGSWRAEFAEAPRENTPELAATLATVTSA